MEQITKDILTFRIDLPKNPLKWLNCYVIKPESGRCLLIDSGFRMEECAESLLAGIRELELVPENTDVFFTHLHADHTGNGGMLEEMGFHTYMSRVDQELRLTNPKEISELHMLDEGMSPEKLELCTNNPARRFAPTHFTPEKLNDGDILTYGEHRLECVLTPGHTPGHMCLYDRENGIMFLGDHVLFDITSNICWWPGTEDSLGDYLNSLDKIKSFDIKTPLPAHRTAGSVTLAERIEVLKTHHEVRLNEAAAIVAAHPGITGYDIAGLMTWSVHGRSRSWEDFPAGQLVFAVGEAIAHLEHLIKLGRIRRETVDGISHYYIL